MPVLYLFVGAPELGLVPLDGVMERPHRPQKRHRVQAQLGGESNALPDGSSGCLAHPEMLARFGRRWRPSKTAFAHREKIVVAGFVGLLHRPL